MPKKQERRKDTRVSDRVRQANQRMREAWRAGNNIKKIEKAKDRKSKQVNGKDKKTPTEAIRQESGRNASRAERLRKYRHVARQISWQELNEICGECTTHGVVWGPTYLVELSRIADAEGRRETSTEAIVSRWSLLQLQRHVSLKVGLPKKTKPAKQATKTGTPPDKRRIRVGRKRKINWGDKVQVLYEMHRLYLGMIRFSEDFDREAEKENKPTIDETIWNDFQKLVKDAAEYNDQLLERINAMHQSLPQPRTGRETDASQA